VKDIDFDELDRAVSSVLDQKPTAVIPEAAQPIGVVTEPAAATDTPAPVEVKTAQAEVLPPADVLAPAPVRPVSDAPAVSAPLAVKRRGKFMDVMHPSADMNPGTSASAPAIPPHKTTLVTPLNQNVSEEPKPPQVTAPDVPDAPAVEPSLVPAPVETKPLDLPETKPSEKPDDDMPELLTATVEDTHEDSKGSFPSSDGYVDPLDMPDHSLTPETKPETEATPVVDPTSQQTPFLADTKVDKRPLGAFGDPETPLEKTDNEDKSPDAATPDAPAETLTVPLPRELQADVVQVESVQEKDDSHVSSPATAHATDGRVEGHPLFDTSTYHEPIAAVHKSKPVWVWWLVGLSVCLVIGAGVGYFLFTAGL